MKNLSKPMCAVALALTTMLPASAQDWQEANPKTISLYPQQNTVRHVIDLSGVWSFQKDAENVGETQNWQNGLQNPTDIAVPGSWNDQFSDMHNYMGTVWYELNSYVPNEWKSQDVFLRIGSANYAAKVWVNGQAVGKHEGGNLPFAFNINNFIQWGKANRITIQIENELKPTRVPTGNLPGGSMMGNYPASNFDFFPYGGLQRNVLLYTVPKKASIQDVTVRTDFEGTTGKLTVLLDKVGAAAGNVNVQGHGANINVPFNGKQTEVKVDIPNVQLWDTQHPNLYKVTVTLGSATAPIDQYEVETGVRTVKVEGTKLLLNGKPIILRGFGKHEDFPVFGRGYAAPVMIKDYNLMKWMGANSFRTSHYPYNENYYSVADHEGFLIIDEIPAVGLFFGDGEENVNIRKQQCFTELHEMINRDKNHPSVIMWSVANEPSLGSLSDAFNGGTKEEGEKAVVELGKNTLGGLIKEAKTIDPTRLACYVAVQGGPDAWMEDCDIICINRYYGWYINAGHLDQAKQYLNGELEKLYNKFHKPMIMTEFGGDCIDGFHSTEDEIYTEEYQSKLIEMYLDLANTKDYMVGMHIWNFADFRTAQGLVRVGGYNRKGVFTVDRTPKRAATMLHERWTKTNKF